MIYYFTSKGRFLGGMSLENDTLAKLIGETIGATCIVNKTNGSTFEKCSNCGTWEDPNVLIGGLCSHCDYIKEIKKWLDFYDEELTKHLEGEIDNYGSKFVLTFKGKKLVLSFGPEEDQYFIDGIRQLLKYYNEEIEEGNN